jgi:hypothetical protein
MNDHPTRKRRSPATSSDDHEDAIFDAAAFDSAVRHCFDKLDRAVERMLHNDPIEAVAVAMGTYLQEMFIILLEEGACNVEEVRAYLSEFESLVLKPADPPAEHETPRMTDAEHI